MATLTNKKPAPPIEKILDRVWTLAAFVHPQRRGEDKLAWINRVLLTHDIERQTIDGKLSLEWALYLWAQLLKQEEAFLLNVQERCQKEK